MARQTLYGHDVNQQQDAKALLNLPLGAWTEQSGAALADFSGGSSSTPGWNAGDETHGIRWNNDANPDPISTSVPIPLDLDPNYSVTMHILAAKTGATSGDAVTWLVEAFNGVDAALYDADTDFGGTSSAMTGDATAKTCQEETLTLAAADIAAAPGVMAFTLQPTDGTLGTDDVILLGVWLEYTKAQLITYPNGYWCCFVTVPFVHKLKAAFADVKNVIGDGTLSATLRLFDPGEYRSGAAIEGDALDNTTLQEVANYRRRIEYDLATNDMLTAPASRTYFLILTGTAAGDRIDQPTLEIQVDDDV